MSSSDINVHVTYGEKTFIHSCKRKDFLKSIADKINIPPDEIEVIDNSSNKATSGKKLDPNNLKGVMKVRITRKNPSSSWSLQSNGQRNSTTASASNAVDHSELVQKLKHNKSLTGKDREYLIQHLNSGNGSVKRKNNSANGSAPETKNRKIQVDPTSLFSLKTSHSQTDDLVEEPKSAAGGDLIFQIKKLASEEKPNAEKESDLMTKEFFKRRNFILKDKPMVTLVKERYPLLFKLAEVRNELDRIMYKGKCAEFLKNISKYAPHILTLPREDDPLLLTTVSKMNSYPTEKQRAYAQEVGALLMLSALLSEPRGYLWVEDEQIEIPDFPYIKCEAKLYDLFFDQYSFKIYAEQKLICVAGNFKEAILCLVAVYFIFDIKYPTEVFHTLAFCEKLFLEANDTDESSIDDFVHQHIRAIKLKWQANKKMS